MRRLVSLALALASASPSLAHADPDDGVYGLAAELPAQAPHALRISGERTTTWAVPGARIVPTTVTIAAQDNENTRFLVDVRYPHHGDCERALLRLGTRTYATTGWGGDDQSCSANFLLDPAAALDAAALFRTTRQDRHAIGDHVRGIFTTPRPRYHAGETIEVVLTMTSPAGAPTVAWQRGGQNRGPRDDQFDFEITRDGQPVPRIEAYNFGGLSFMDELAPSDHDEARTPLAPWADLSRPGHYEVRCSFSTLFAPAGNDPYAATTRGEVWDRTFTGTVSFDVVP
ncbi:MAG: hypothetical protein K1X94_27680 [Sandaracinaceae bacterium]|nr:hypothetical protein [Sandaracinaceae bacterium]